MPLTRLSPAWAFALAVLAAWALDALPSDRGRARVVRAVAVAAAGAAWILAFRWSGVRLFEADAQPGLLDVDTARVNMRAHVDLLSLLFAGGVLGVAATAALPSRAALWIGSAVAVAAQIAASWTSIGNYVPVVDNADVLPRTKALVRLQSQLGDERVVFLTRDHLSVNANVPFAVRMIASYDAVGIRDYSRLIDEFFGHQGYGGETLRATGKGLDLFGARYVMTSSEWLPIDTELASKPGKTDGLPVYYDWVVKDGEQAKQLRLPVRIEPVRQEFVARRDLLSGVVVHFEPAKAADSPLLEVAVVDLETGERIGRRQLYTHRIRRLSAICGEFALYFPPQPHSAGKRYAVEVARKDGRLQPKSFLWRKLDAPGPEDVAVESHDFDGWSLHVGDNTIRGRIVVDVAYGDDLILHGDVGWLRLFERKTAPGRAWIARDAIVAADHEAAWKAVLDASFDPRESVVLESPAVELDLGASAPPPKLERTGESTTWSSFRATCSQPCYLVVTQPFYPGWKATLDGREVPLLRANYAFTAIALPAGTSNVTLRYQPLSLLVGAAISALGTLTLAVAALVVWRRRAVLLA
jgi:hypothetical protein